MRGSNQPLKDDGGKDASAEVAGIAIAVSNALDDLNGIVDALGKAVGVGRIESVEDVGSPVLQHGKAGIEFRD